MGFLYNFVWTTKQYVSMQIKHIFALFTLVLCPYSYASNPWKLCLTDPKEKVTLTIDLHEESIEVPGMEMFGLMNGYLGGNIYGVWAVTSFKMKKEWEQCEY